MKQWIKKIVLGACLAFSLMALAGCAKETTVKTIDPQEKASLESSSLRYVESLAALSETEIQASIDQAEHDKNSIVYNGLTNYKNSLNRLGAFVSADSAVASLNEDGSYTVEVDSTFEQRKLKLTLGLAEDMQSFTEMTFEPEYTFAEEFIDAGGNLVVGMGTVVCVLLFIAWIISLFKYINIFEKKMKDRKAAAAAAKAPTPAPAAPASPKVTVAPAAQAAVSGDELQAVIAAAIAAYEADMGTEENGFVPGPTLNNGLIVRSIRRR